ncbi:MAG: glycosyltransferase [Bacteroidota bacterium]|nr:glycosyltransferase [Bacteroidota bacterium]
MKAVAKTLVVLTPGFPANESDSTCLPAQQVLIQSLNRQFKKLKIILVSFQYPFVSTPFLWNGNQVIPLFGRNKGKLNRLLTWLKAWKTLKRINKENDVAGILSFWCTECALLGSRFGKKRHIPHFIWILGQDARKENKFVSWIKPASENLLAVSRFLAEEFFKNHGIRPAHIIPNGLDSSLFPPGNENRDIDLLGVGSLISLKQYDAFIRVVNKLRGTIPGITCFICGKGPEEERLRKMILDHDLQKNISLTGERDHAEVLQWMGRCKILLHPSRYEGFSTVCLEALYTGAHVISLCDPMMGKISHWHTVQNEKEMAAVAQKIITDRDIDYGRVLVYSMDDSAKKLMALFHYADA